ARSGSRRECCDSATGQAGSRSRAPSARRRRSSRGGRSASAREPSAQRSRASAIERGPLRRWYPSTWRSAVARGHCPRGATGSLKHFAERAIERFVGPLLSLQRAQRVDSARDELDADVRPAVQSRDIAFELELFAQRLVPGEHEAQHLVAVAQPIQRALELVVASPPCRPARQRASRERNRRAPNEIDDAC